MTILRLVDLIGGVIMKRASLILGLAASAAILVSTAANALVVTVGGTSVAGQGQFSSVAGATTYDFSGASPFTGVGPNAGAQLLYTGSVGGQNAQPFDDFTQYASIGTSDTPQTATLVLAAGFQNYVGLYWGSIDTYNLLKIHYADGTSESVTSVLFPILTPSNGDQTSLGSKYVNIFTTKDIASLTFYSESKAFEFDNLAVAAVPEASTWAMMILGFLGLGFFGYRKSSKTSGPAFRVA